MSRNRDAWSQWWAKNYKLAPNYSSLRGATIHDLIDALGNSDLPVPADSGRKVAAIVYVDELPEVVDSPHGGKATRIQGLPPSDSMAALSMYDARNAIALARYYEARDAAAKEQGAEVEALRVELARAGEHSTSTKLAEYIRDNFERKGAE